ncbi:MAG TPA: hypothetical protein VN493_30945 [Thermoanaerobaculia bacterium]|nr:hypothetical protein [Thermoanaerobaculia bacterium]
MRAKALAAALAVLAAMCHSSWAQGPVWLTSEIPIEEGASSEEKSLPAVAFGSDSGFMVVWKRAVTTSNEKIRARLYLADGTPTGSAFQINSFTGPKSFPAVAALPGGTYIVAWEEGVASLTPGTDASGSSVRARIYENGGSEFQVNTFTTGHQGHPAVAAIPNGNFVIVWQSDGSNGTDQSATSIQAQRFNASGTPLGSEFQVNTHTPGSQMLPTAAAESGGFVVAWQSSVSASNQDSNIRARRFDESGNPLGDDFQVNTFMTGSQSSPDLVIGTANDFFVVWKSGELLLPGPDGAHSSIQGRRYDASGTPLGDEFQINTQHLEDQGDPTIARDVDGDCVVLWFDRIEPGDTAFLPGGVRGQRFNADGSRRGTEFRVNTTIPSAQDTPDVAIGPGGDFLAVWRSFGQGTTGEPTIIGRLFSGSQALALNLDFHTLVPCRAVDTRTGAPLASGSPITFQVAGVCDVPSTAKTVAVNVTVAGPTGNGYVKLWPSDIPEPVSTVINFGTGLTRANNALVFLATDGSGEILAKAILTDSGTVHLVIDVTGYFEGEP